MALPALAEDTGPALEKFRAAYEGGTGFSYVVIEEEKGERVYMDDATRNSQIEQLKTAIARDCR